MKNNDLIKLRFRIMKQCYLECYQLAGKNDATTVRDKMKLKLLYIDNELEFLDNQNV